MPKISYRLYGRKSYKYNYGQDVAIISCEELNKNYNGNCKKLITEYMEEKPENTIIGAQEYLTDFKKTSEISDEEIIATSQSKEGSKSHDSIGQYNKPPKNLNKILLNHGIIKNSKILKMKDTLKKTFNPIELKLIKSLIIKRVLKLLIKKKKEFFTFLDSLFGFWIKNLN